VSYYANGLGTPTRHDKLVKHRLVIG
jgi:hypothetical protein